MNEEKCNEMLKSLACSVVKHWWTMIPVGMLFMSGLVKGSVDTMLVASILAIIVYQLRRLAKKIENCCWY